ncbi:hypothetical protein [Streptomyces erythrochromogenes]|uniref:hypothetical protein n=1 Tax=Streptomyces erythrochromogenes TaxID=285574 RepID=UPI0038042EA0
MKSKRLVASLLLTAAAVAVPVAAAAPASASGRDCMNMAKALGYIAGPKVAGACGFPAIEATLSKPWKSPNDGCMNHLERAGISNWNHRFGICLQA